MSSDSEPSELSLFLSNERGDRVIRAFRGFTSTSLPAADSEHYEQRDSMNGHDTSSGEEKPPQPPLPMLKRRSSKLVHHRVIEAHRSPHPSPRLRLVTNATGAYVEEDNSSSSSVDLTDDEHSDSAEASQSNSTEREVRTLLEKNEAKLVVVNDCSLLYASDSVIVGNNNNVFGDNNFILGDGNIGYGNHLRAHGARNCLQGVNCTNFDTSRAGSVNGNLSVRIRVIPQSLLMRINKSHNGDDVQQLVRRLSLSDKMPLRQNSATQLAANGEQPAPKLSQSAAAAVPDYSTADSGAETPILPRRKQKKKRLRKRKNI
jgi:hypothetical protein